MPTPLPTLHDWRLSVDYEGIAWALMDREGERVNSMGRRFTEELGEIVKWAETAAIHGEIKGLVLMSAKPTGFLVGADIREFSRFATEAQVKEVVKESLQLFDSIEKLPIPVVAAIHGFCLGGGLELALACHYRIADREESTRLGFPEVKLGIFPGLNGTVRSIQLAGPMDAMTAMLTGRMLRPTAAKAMGLIDQVVATHHNLRWAARKAVLQKRRSKGIPWWKQMMLKQPVRSLLAKQMRAKTAEKVREDHYPAPYRLIDLFEQYGDDPARMRDGRDRDLRAADGERHLAQSPPRVHALRDAEGRGAEERLQAANSCTSSAPAPWAATSPPGAWCAACRRACRISTRVSSRRRSPAPRGCSRSSSAARRRSTPRSRASSPTRKVSTSSTPMW